MCGDRVETYGLITWVWGNPHFSTALDEGWGCTFTFCISRETILMGLEGVSMIGWLWSLAIFPGLVYFICFSSCDPYCTWRTLLPKTNSSAMCGTCTGILLMLEPAPAAPQKFRGSSIPLPKTSQWLAAFIAPWTPRNPGRNTCTKNTVLSSGGSCLLLASHQAPVKSDQSGWGLQAIKSTSFER